MYSSIPTSYVGLVTRKREGKVVKHSAVCFWLFGGFILFAVLPAEASTMFTLNADACTGSCGTAPFATVSLVQTSATDVTVTETLRTGEVYAGTSAGNALGFNVVGAATSLSDISSGFAVGPANDKYSALGTFQYSIVCTDCQGGQLTNPSGPLVFTVSRATGLTIASFIVNANGYYFASDIRGLNGNTGVVGTSAQGVPVTTSTPEPLTMLLAGAGLLALGLVKSFPRNSSR